jgi:periplasmic divalent cation tolerance protein
VHGASLPQTAPEPMSGPPSPADPILILTSCPDEAAASAIARALVESGLAACVSRVGPVHSTYRWQGAIHDEPEVLLVIKSVTGRYAELEMRLKSLHPYELPEIIVVGIESGSAEYLAWLGGAVA